jgi:hypothetical protein
MLRRCITQAAGALAVVCGGLLLTATAIAQPKQAAKVSAHDILAMEVDINGLQEPIPLKELLQVIYERTKKQRGADVPILVDALAFREANPEAQNGPYDDPVTLPIVARGLKMAQVLQLVASQLRTPAGAAFIVRNGMIEITTREHAILPMLLEERIVAKFDKTPFNEVIRELVEMTGAPILIDPRLQEKAKVPITAELNGNVSLAALLPILADMADLRIVRIASSSGPRKLKDPGAAAAAAGAGHAELVAVSPATHRSTAHQPPPPPEGGLFFDEELSDGCLYITTPANAEAMENRRRAERAEKAKAIMGVSGTGGMAGVGGQFGGLGLGGQGGGLGGGLIPAGGLNSGLGLGGGGGPPTALPPGTPGVGNTLSPEVARLQAEVAALRAEVARLRQGKTEPRKDAK